MKKIISMIMVMLVPLWVISGCGYGGGGTDGGNPDDAGAEDGGDGKCTPHAGTTCAEGVTYWLDSCLNMEEVKEMCSCGCNAGGSDCETCGDLPCQSNTDCPQGFYCDLNTNKCKEETCVPNCTGKCCGNDGCGSICSNNCPAGYVCDLGTCQCKPDTECTSNEDCLQGYYCDYTVHECKQICTPQCEGKCCGGDGCGSTCPNSCPTGYTCDMGSCFCMPYCTSNSQCPTMQCCIEGTCTPAACSNTICGPDPVCGFNCGTCPSGSHCEYGQCVPDSPGDLCPTGQECLTIGAEGVLGCLIPPDTIPSGNQTGCADGGCTGNFSCYCVDEQCTESICIENCGTCPTGLECCPLTANGMVGCLTPGSCGIPANPPYCDGSTPCQGNAGCFTDGSTNFCINFCSTE